KTGEGGEGGGGGTHDKGSRTIEGGVDSETATLTGELYGDPIGAKGGEGEHGDRGARGALALFGGLINVPNLLRPAVEVALIIEEGNIFGLGKDFFKKGIRKFTSAATTRKALAREAREQSAKRMRQIRPRLAKNKAFKQL